MTNYYENYHKEAVRACPDLEDLSDLDRGKWHTMGSKLLPYVSSKFSNLQVRFIEKCLREKTPIQVHGVFEDHLTDCLRVHNLRQKPFDDGGFKLSRIHKSATSKSFNFERPFFVNTVNENNESVAILVAFPSREYVCQSAELLYAFIKLNLQLVASDMPSASYGLDEGTASRFCFERVEAANILSDLISTEQVSQFFYPDAFDAFPQWSGLERAAQTGLVCEGDIIVIGYVDKIAEILIKEHGFQVLPFENREKWFSLFGPRELLGALVLISQNSARRVVLLGFTHSFWGRTAAKLVATCLRAGACHIVYVAKAGTRTGRISAPGGSDRNKHFLCLIGGQYLIWEGDAEDQEGRVREVSLKASQNSFMGLFPNKNVRSDASRSHLTVPTVVGEDATQHKAYGNYNPSSVDNEISFIAEEIGMFERECPGKEITFSCIHFITDLVVSNLNVSSSIEPGLDRDHHLMPEKVEFWTKSAEKLAIFIEANGAKYSGPTLSFDRMQSGRKIFFDRHGKTVPLLKDHIFRKKVYKSRLILDCYPEIEERPRLEEAIIRGGKGSTFQFRGEAGSGKSVLAENLFFFLSDAFDRNEFQFQPYYVDITSYEKGIIHDGKSTEEVWSDVLDRLMRAIHESGPLAIIYDGIDEQSPFRSEIQKFLRKETRSQGERDCISIFFKRVYRNVRDDHRERLSVLGVDVGIGEEYDLGSLAHDDGRVVGVKENLTRLLALTAEIDDDVAKELTGRISSWPEFKVNLRLLNLVRDSEHRNQSQFDGPTSFFRQFSDEYLKENSSGMAIDKLKNLAQKASYEFLIESKPFPVSTREEVLVKRLSTQSMEMLCYLAALNLDVRLFDREGYGEDRVFPHLINKYSKDLLRTRDQKGAFSRLRKILSDEKSGIRLKSFTAYLLGRISDPDVRKGALGALNSAKRALASGKVDGMEQELLIFDRSINISLIYLGQDSNEYITKLMNSRRHDEINRGFHLAYYGDVDYFSSPDMLDADDGFCRFDRSAANLIGNLRKRGIGSNLMNLSAYTLFSLAHSRLLHGGLRTRDERADLVKLAKDDLLRREDLHSEVKDFVRNCALYLESDLGPDAFGFSQVARLKSHSRAGWNDPSLGRSVPSCETVFAHVGSAIYLALVYLPEDIYVEGLVNNQILPSEYLSYKKDIVIRMLAIHDIGEHDVGDIASPRKTEDDAQVERNSVRFLTMLSHGVRGEFLSGYSESVWDLWLEFSSGISINAKIARDIDILECLLQLHDYSRGQNNRIDDFEAFRRKLLDGFSTEIGKELAGQFSKSYYREDD